MKNVITAIAIWSVVLSIVAFSVYKYENPIQETWARNYIEKNIADGWGINSIQRAYSPSTPYYEVFVELYELKTFHNQEPFRLYHSLYFDKKGALVRNNLKNTWKK